MPRRKTITDLEVLAVARNQFLQEGPGASTRSIAKEAGISEAVLFQRFGTKDGLFFAAMVPPPAEFDEIFRVTAGQSSVAANLETISRGILIYFRQMMPIFLPLVTHPAFDLRSFLTRHEISAVQITERHHQYLRAEFELGRVDEIRIGGAASLLIAMVHNLALAETIGASDPKESSQAISTTIATIWDGLHPKSD